MVSALAPGPLPSGAVLTTINGKQCTMVPKAGASAAATTTTTQDSNTATTAAAVVATDSSSSGSSNTNSGNTDNTGSTGSTDNNSNDNGDSLSTTSTTSSTSSQESTNIALVNVPPPVLVSEASTDDQTSQVSPPPSLSSLAAETAAAGTVGSFQQISSPSPSQDSSPSAAQTSVTDNPPVPEQAGSPTALAQSDISAGGTPPGPTESAGLVSTIGFSPEGTAAGENAAAPTGSDIPTVGTTGAQGSNGSSGGGHSAPTIIMVGSIVGGLAFLSLIAFLIWFWRKRSLQRRRSTMLTPLTPASDFRPDEKGGYTIDRGSLGPTPRSEKLRAALGYSFKRLRGQVANPFSRTRDDATSVNMNRGNSQFMEPTHSRASSTQASMRSGARDETGAKVRFMDWWGRFKADAGFGRRQRNRSADNDPFAAARDLKEKNAAMSAQPDFLTLLGMDSSDVDREAQRRRLSRAQGSGGSGDHFLGSLGLNFESSDPFSDNNALPHDSAKPAPLSMALNPFSDSNAITAPVGGKQPANYVANVRRSRGQSVTNNTNAGGYTSRLDSVYRESGNSVESFQTRRNKFRSDPFDLDRPELLANRQKVTSSNFSTAGSNTPPRLSSNTSGSLEERFASVRRPAHTHTRQDSYSSKYSSGISMGDWSDPGPDVGPAANRWDSESPTRGWRAERQSQASGKRQSGESQKSVGKAL